MIAGGLPLHRAHRGKKVSEAGDKLAAMLPIQSFATAVLVEAIRRQPASKERTAFAWQLAVGPALARATTVELDDKGVLAIRSRDARWLRELERAKPAVLQKMQDLLGKDQVTRLRLQK
jgi:predicted nucleic acid-binding Zn ribbon protein